MTRSETLTRNALALGLISLAGAATARSGNPFSRADVAPVERMNLAARAYVFQTFAEYEGLIASENVWRLAIIAKQKALSLICDGYDLDEARFNAALMTAVGPIAEVQSETSAGFTLPFMKPYSAFATFLGGDLAVAAYDPEATCAYGPVSREELTEDDGTSLLIWTDAN